MRKKLKKISKNEKINNFMKNYKIPQEYLATNRKMITRAIFLGIFIALIPMPMQMVAIILFIPFIKFNVPLALAMCWVTNPFTMPIIYYVEYTTGSFVLNIPIEKVEMSIEWFSNNISNIFIPLYFGAFFYSILLSTTSYFLVNFFWRNSVKKDKNIHYKNRK
ncbi:MAG: DUF2062 domain-containing protein [Campylobacterota bacterium]|nr:DUF2062 domain-containing protein [Campylobacterota bacterium]